MLIFEIDVFDLMNFEMMNFFDLHGLRFVYIKKSRWLLQMNMKQASKNGVYDMK